MFRSNFTGHNMQIELSVRFSPIHFLSQINSFNTFANVSNVSLLFLFLIKSCTHRSKCAKNVILRDFLFSIYIIHLSISTKTQCACMYRFNNRIVDDFHLRLYIVWSNNFKINWSTMWKAYILKIDQFRSIEIDLLLSFWAKRSCRLHRNWNDKLFWNICQWIFLLNCDFAYMLRFFFYSNRFNFIVLSFREFGIVFHYCLHQINFTEQWRASTLMCNSFVLHVDKYRFTVVDVVNLYVLRIWRNWHYITFSAGINLSRKSRVFCRRWTMNNRKNLNQNTVGDSSEHWEKKMWIAK